MHSWIICQQKNLGTPKPQHLVSTLVFTNEKSIFPFKKGIKVKNNSTVKNFYLKITAGSQNTENVQKTEKDRGI